MWDIRPYHVTRTSTNGSEVYWSLVYICITYLLNMNCLNFYTKFYVYKCSYEFDTPIHFSFTVHLRDPMLLPKLDGI